MGLVFKSSITAGLAVRLIGILGILFILCGCAHRESLREGIEAGIEEFLGVQEHGDRSEQERARPHLTVLKYAGPYVDPQPYDNHQQALNTSDSMPGSLPDSVGRLWIGEMSTLDQLQALSLLFDVPLYFKESHLRNPSVSEQATTATSEVNLAEQESPAVRMVNSTWPEVIRMLSQQLNLSLRLTESGLTVNKYTEKIFNLSHLAGDSRQELLDSDGGLELGSQGGRAVIDLENSSDFWEELTRQIELVADFPVTVHVIHSLASVGVKATPNDMARIEGVIQKFNDSLSKQVSVDVRLLQIQLEDIDEFGLNWEQVHQDLHANSSVDIGTPFTNSPNFSVGLSPLSADEGIGVLINAFSRQGDVKVVTSPRGVTLNHQIMRIELLTQTSYLAQTNTTLAGDGSTTLTGLVPGVVESGFTLLVVPSVIGEDIVMQLSINISSLENIDSVNSGDQTIQVPVLTESRFTHRAKVASGETLVLGGVRQIRENRSAKRTSLYSSSRRTRVERVLLVTPRLVSTKQRQIKGSSDPS